jgi:hypothetical protein
VQTKNTQAHVTSEWNNKARDDGYVAYVVNAILVKMQIDRMRENEKQAFFTDKATAEEWLLNRAHRVDASRVA